MSKAKASPLSKPTKLKSDIKVDVATDVNPLIEPVDTDDPDSDIHADPDSRRDEAVKEAKHKNILFFHRAFPLFVGLLLFLLLFLLFILLPFSAMEHGFNGGIFDFVVMYSRAFRESTRTIFIAVATIIVSDLLKRFYDYIKRHIKDE